MRLSESLGQGVGGGSGGNDCVVIAVPRESALLGFGCMNPPFWLFDAIADHLMVTSDVQGPAANMSHAVSQVHGRCSLEAGVGRKARAARDLRSCLKKYPTHSCNDSIPSPHFPYISLCFFCAGSARAEAVQSREFKMTTSF